MTFRNTVDHPGALDALLGEYSENGVAVLPGVFEPGEIERLRGASWMVLSQLDLIRKNGYLHDPFQTVSREGVEFPALVFWPALANRYLERMRSDPRLARIVETILGPDVKQLNNQLYYRLPGDTDSFSWHQDIMFRSPRDQYPMIVEEDGYLQTAIVIDRMGEDNAPIIFVPGSHKLGDLDLVPENYEGLRGFDAQRNSQSFSHLEPRVYSAEPGDVVVWSSLTVHGSAGNESSRSRMYYMNGFARSRNCRPWPHYLKRGRAVELESHEIP